MGAGKHTPGPWLFAEAMMEVEDPEGWSITAVADASCFEHRSDEECCANGHLIAAAPDMLFALRLAHYALDQHADGSADADAYALHRMLTAIAKAEGRS